MAEIPAGTNADVRRILELCRDIEGYAAKLYHYYAEIFSDTPEISKLWEKTAMEEENHAHQFVLAINLLKHGVVQDVSVGKESAETMLKKFKSLYEAVRQSKPKTADALKLAINIEDKLSEYHMSTVAIFQEESHKMLFESMMKNDRGHVVELEKAYQNVLASQK